MSDVKSTVRKASSSRKGDAAGSVSPARARQFHETEQRMKALSAPTLADVLRLAPDDSRMAKIRSGFGLDGGDPDELVGLGDSAIRDQYTALRPILVSHYRGEDDFRGLKMHLDRIVDAFVRSAYGAANFFESRRQIAKDAKDAWKNEQRDEDHMGIDGGENHSDVLVRIAAEHGAKAYALACIASGACAAYAELMGEAWEPYQPRANRRSLTQEAAAALDDALGI
ncbi:hypothetical protein [Acetobacter vaccinii]|uniref:Uncharacterized protein n=1 Tax=Acetobacter vaccinii TaxID=2592655 RepID=A0A5C1YS62_9PROT|nr:hypothetical protein [Acetobacter vaccinii]QEO18911.1 hypothetical protein FLP30_13635 [Acetobacter vaccinii]